MAKNILIRDLDKDDLEWIKEATPSGMSQNEFIKKIIHNTKKKKSSFSTFNNDDVPETIFAKLPFKYIDLFAGIGGFRSGLTPYGGKCVFSSEWDKYSALTYKAWYNDDNIYENDIRDINIKKMIPDHDILCAGFPCQPFSLAGVSKKQSLGIAHGFDDVKQGNLFHSIMKIVDIKKPPVIFLENVKNLISHDKGNTWKTIKKEIESRGYLLFSKVINANYCVPQSRQRIYIVCFDTKIFGSEISFDFPEQTVNQNLTLATILSDKPDTKYMLSDKLWLYLQNYAKKHKEKGNGFGFGLNTKDSVCRTMSARYYKDGSEILIKQLRWKNPRRLTPEEAKLLMGFNDHYAILQGHNKGFPQVVSDTQAYRQFGNAVVPKVIEDIAQNIINLMAETILNRSAGNLLKTRI